MATSARCPVVRCPWVGLTAGILLTGCLLGRESHSEEQLPFALNDATPGWWQAVGATPFDPNNTLDITDFCSPDPPPDSTDCALRWVQAARTQGKHLWASEGTYTLSESLPVFDGMHLRCESQQTIFQKRGDRGSPHFASERYGDPQNPVTNVLIENCGFDMNGDASNFASSIRLSQASQVTVRGNRIFDSTGVRWDTRDRQRQYVLILTATDILVERNHLSEGGRIKVGQPGRRLVIRNNLLDFVNDNGITVVSTSDNPWPDGTNVSEDILIADNDIRNPTVTGIFFGADGEPNGVGVTTRRVTIINNRIIGPASSCIKGVLPDQASDIWIGQNACQQQTPTFEWSDNVFNSGIRLDRANDTTGTAAAITIFGNTITTEALSTLDLGAVFMGDPMEACLLNNRVRNSSLAIRVTHQPVVYVDGNDWGGGRVRVEDAVVQPLGTFTCFVPKTVIRHY